MVTAKYSLQDRLATHKKFGFTERKRTQEVRLGPMYAATFFQSQWDESVDAVHTAMGWLPPPQFRSPAQEAANPLQPEPEPAFQMPPMPMFGVASSVREVDLGPDLKELTIEELSIGPAIVTTTTSELNPDGSVTTTVE